MHRMILYSSYMYIQANNMIMNTCYIFVLCRPTRLYTHVSDDTFYHTANQKPEIKYLHVVVLGCLFTFSSVISPFSLDCAAISILVAIQKHYNQGLPAILFYTGYCSSCFMYFLTYFCHILLNALTIRGLKYYILRIV